MCVFNFRHKIKLVRLLIFLFVMQLFDSCSNRQRGIGYKIEKADSVFILFNESGKIYTHSDTSKRLISSFVKVLDGKVEKRRCPVMGEIAFYSNGKLVFEAGVSIENGEKNCQFLMGGDDAWRLTYNTGMYLTETLAELKRNK